MGELMGERRLGNDAAATIAMCRRLSESVNRTLLSVKGRFESFERRSQTLWDDLNAEAFSQFRQLIQSHHATLGGVLCGLTLKLGAWDEKMEHTNALPSARFKFMATEMQTGFKRIVALEAAAPERDFHQKIAKSA
jgi:hypothetical protein